MDLNQITKATNIYKDVYWTLSEQNFVKSYRLLSDISMPLIWSW